MINPLTCAELCSKLDSYDDRIWNLSVSIDGDLFDAGPIEQVRAACPQGIEAGKSCVVVLVSDKHYHVLHLFDSGAEPILDLWEFKPLVIKRVIDSTLPDST